MKILLDFYISKDEMEDILDNFEGVKYISVGDGSYEEVIVDTKKMIYQNFEDWIQPFLDIGYALEWDNNRNIYILTE